VEFENWATAYVNYSGDFRKRLYSHLVTLGMSVKF